ncbi:hypothetical protein [Streptomyces sp. NBC_00158]|uniref:hypothetical protein n=1 Tax=Streptomyces sp. NBC_00158 TaxID=2903627 RepID=UPI003245681C
MACTLGGAELSVNLPVGSLVGARAGATWAVHMRGSTPYKVPAALMDLVLISVLAVVLLVPAVKLARHD